LRAFTFNAPANCEAKARLDDRAAFASSSATFSDARPALSSQPASTRASIALKAVGRRQPKLIPIHRRFLSEVVNRKRLLTPTLSWVWALAQHTV